MIGCNDHEAWAGDNESHEEGGRIDFVTLLMLLLMMMTLILVITYHDDDPHSELIMNTYDGE